MPNIISERTTMSQGMPITVTTVNGMDRIEINNKLHEIGDQLLKLKMEQQRYLEMRNQIDRQNEIIEMGDLFDELFGGWVIHIWGLEIVPIVWATPKRCKLSTKTTFKHCSISSSFTMIGMSAVSNWV